MRDHTAFRFVDRLWWAHPHNTPRGYRFKPFERSNERLLRGTRFRVLALRLVRRFRRSGYGRTASAFPPVGLALGEHLRLGDDRFGRVAQDVLVRVLRPLPASSGRRSAASRRRPLGPYG